MSHAQCRSCGQPTDKPRRGLCARCYTRQRRAREPHQGWGVDQTLRHTAPPIDTTGWNPRCAHGHEWTPDNTRWRHRHRGSHGTGWERDCRACERERARNKHHHT